MRQWDRARERRSISRRSILRREPGRPGQEERNKGGISWIQICGNGAIAAENVSGMDKGGRPVIRTWGGPIIVVRGPLEGAFREPGWA